MTTKSTYPSYDGRGKSELHLTVHDGTERNQEGYPGAVILLRGDDYKGGTRVQVHRLDKDSSVATALEILKVLAPDKLAPEPAPRLADHAFVRSTENGKIYRITGPAKGLVPGADFANAVDSTGYVTKIYNTEDSIYWVPVEVEVIPAREETWQVVE